MAKLVILLGIIFLHPLNSYGGDGFNKLKELSSRYDVMEFSLDNSRMGILSKEMKSFLNYVKADPEIYKHPAIKILRNKYSDLKKMLYIKDVFKKCLNTEQERFKKLGLENLNEISQKRLNEMYLAISQHSKANTECEFVGNSFKNISELEKELQQQTKIAQLEKLQVQLHEQAMLQLARNLADFRFRYREFPNKNKDPYNFLCKRKEGLLKKREMDNCSTIEKKMKDSYSKRLKELKKNRPKGFNGFSNKDLVQNISERNKLLNKAVTQLNSKSKKYKAGKVKLVELRNAYQDYARTYALETSSGAGILFRTEEFEDSVGKLEEFKASKTKYKMFKTPNVEAIQRSLQEGNKYLQSRASQLFEKKDQAYKDKIGYQGSEEQRKAIYARRLHPDVYLRKLSKSVSTTLLETPGIAANLVAEKAQYAGIVCKQLIASVRHEDSKKKVDKVVFWGQVVGGVVFVPTAAIGVGAWIFRGSTAFRSIALTSAAVGRISAAMDGVLGMYSAQKAYASYEKSHRLRAFLVSANGTEDQQKRLREASHAVVDESIAAVMSLGVGATQAMVSLSTLSSFKFGNKSLNAGDKLNEIFIWRKALGEVNYRIANSPKLAGFLQKMSQSGSAQKVSDFIHTLSGLPQNLRVRILNKLDNYFKGKNIEDLGSIEKRFSTFTEQAMEVLKKCK